MSSPVCINRQVALLYRRHISAHWRIVLCATSLNGAHRCYRFLPGCGGWYMLGKLNGTPAASSTSLFTSLHPPCACVCVRAWVRLFDRHLPDEGGVSWADMAIPGNICYIFFQLMYWCRCDNYATVISLAVIFPRRNHILTKRFTSFFFFFFIYNCFSHENLSVGVDICLVHSCLYQEIFYVLCANIFGKKLKQLSRTDLIGSHKA